MLTAGLGTRLKPYTSFVAKPLLPLMGVPFIQYVFDLLNRSQIKKTICNIHHLGSQTSQALSFCDLKSDLLLSDERLQLLGSGGGIVKAARQLSARPFFVLNGDTLAQLYLQDLAKKHFELHQRYGVRMTLALLPQAPAGEMYSEVITDASNERITGLGVKRFGGRFFTGVSVIDPSIFSGLESGRPYEFFDHLMQPLLIKKQVGAFFIDPPHFETSLSQWMDIGSPALWYHAHERFIRMLENEALPTPWETRVRMHNSEIAKNAWAFTENGAAEASRIQLRGNDSDIFYWARISMIALFLEQSIATKSCTENLRRRPQSFRKFLF